jgi:radical SAM superfamily enzyme YgiQ (UPF0313 family)
VKKIIIRDAMKLLLTSVFKPFGVDDKYGRKENKLELYHNQITREQGIFSLRSNHFYRSYGLYLIAVNINVPTVVLDFPSLRRFIKEIKKGYENIGISFILPNFIKAKKMAELIRKYSPKSKIILGGHGAMIPDIEKLIFCDYVVRGDGVEWMRKYFNEDVNKPFEHPIIPTNGTRTMLGVTQTSNSGFILTGNGCPIGCRFCSTSHLFNKKYTPFLKTGKEIYDVASKFEKAFSTKSFFIMDENFPIQKTRMLEFVDLMERHDKKWEFNVFSSANAILSLGLEKIVRMNVKRMWIGVESRFDSYEKNKDIDIADIIKSLQGYGITVLISMILLNEHHTKKNIWEDIDYAISLKPDFIQFMLLGPFPQTKLYLDLKKQGKLYDNIPNEEKHGQSRIWFEHPEFTLEESEKILKEAFLKDYNILGPSLLRIYRTKLKGYKNLKNSAENWFRKKSDILAEECRSGYPFIAATATMATQKHIRDLARQTIEEYKMEFGSVTNKQQIREVYINVMARYATIKYAIFGDVKQHKTIYTTYRL